MQEEELKRAAANRRRQAERLKQEAKRKNGKRAKRKAAKEAEAKGLPAKDSKLYTHNSSKPGSAFHIATSRGTICKLEHSGFMRYQDTVTETPPPKRRLCQMCATGAVRKELDAEIDWNRLATF